MELNCLPSNNLISKINQLIQRCHQVKAHSFIMSYLKEQFSSQWFHKEQKKHELIEQLPHIFHTIYINNSNEVSIGDFPDVLAYQKVLQEANWSEFHQIKGHHPELIAHVNNLLNNQLSGILHEIQYNTTIPKRPLNGNNNNNQSQQQSQSSISKDKLDLQPHNSDVSQQQEQTKTIIDPINHPEQITNRYHQHQGLILLIFYFYSFLKYLFFIERNSLEGKPSSH